MTGSGSATGSSSGSPFVGREPELAALRDSLASALDGHGRIVLLTGEPGIGKTRTAEEIMTEALAQSAMALWGRCQEWEGAPAYWPWLQILRRYVERTDAGTVEADLNGLATDLSQIMPELAAHAPAAQEELASYPPEQRRFRLFDAMSRLLRSVSQRQPVVLVLDDLHWADQPSLRLLEFVAQDVHELPLLLIATYRNVELDRQHLLTGTLAELSRDPASRRIILHGLGTDDVGRYIELASDRTPPSGLVEAVLAETEGNPFFVTEVVGWLQREGRLAEGGATGGWTIRIPESIREAIGNRLDRLSSETNEMLTIAAVIGREFQLQLLARATEREALDLLDHLDEAVQSGVLENQEQPGDYRFRHALIQETLSNELTTSRRLRLHVTVGSAIEAHYAGNLAPHYPELAHHFSESALAGNVEKAIEYATRAGDQAMDRAAWESAEEYYGRVVEISADLGATGDIHRCPALLGLSLANWGAGDVIAAREIALRAAHLAHKLDDPRFHVLAAKAFTGGDYFPGWSTDAQAVKLLEDALEYGGEIDAGAECDIYTRLALYLPPSRDSYKQRRFYADKALAIADQLQDDRLIIRASFAKCFALRDGPDTFGPETHAIRLDHEQAARELAERTNDGTLLGYTVWWDVYESLLTGTINSDEYRNAIERIRSITADHRTLTTTLGQDIGDLQVLILEGRFSDALTLVSVLRNGPMGRTHQYFDAILGQFEFVLYRELDSLDDYLISVDRFIVTDQDFHMYWRIRRCLAQIETGDIAGGAEAFDRLASESFADARFGWNMLLHLVTLAEIAHLLRDMSRASVLYEILLPTAHLNANTLFGVEFLGSVAYYLGLLATTLERWDDAEEHFEFALERHEFMQLPPYIANTRYQYAAMLVKRGDEDDIERARDLNEQALAAAREMEMLRLERLATALAEEIELRDDAIQADRVPHGLTPRELEVLVYLVQGRTDREIANELFISPRTVMNHVSNILGKLDVPSRSAAAAVAVREELI